MTPRNRSRDKSSDTADEMATSGKDGVARNKRRSVIWITSGVVVAGVIAFVLLYFEPQAAFFDDTVNETLPGLDAATGSGAAQTLPGSAANSVSAALRQASSSGEPVVVSTGAFISGEHDTKGTARIVALPDGSLVMRFEALDTTNGPDLRVVLSPDTASNASDYNDRLKLAELKGNIGDQNYTLGADIDLGNYKSVVIWCERFSVAFGAAPIDVTA